MKSLYKAEVIGNLTRDVELRYTGSGTAVASFSIATNRSWMSDGVKQEAVDYHNIVAWGKLGEICGQLLSKGTKCFISGRMQTRKWQAKDGSNRYSFEVIAEDMIVLSSKSQEVKAAESSGILDEPEEKYESDKSGIEDEIPF